MKSTSSFGSVTKNQDHLPAVYRQSGDEKVIFDINIISNIIIIIYLFEYMNYHEGIWAESQDKKSYFEVAQTHVDSYISLGDLHTIVLRSPFWGNGLLCNDTFREAFMSVVNRDWLWVAPWELSKKPILLQDEHQLPHEPQSYLVIKRLREQGDDKIMLRWLKYSANQVILDTTVILEAISTFNVKNPRSIYLGGDDFLRVIRLFTVAHKIQIERYQSRVNELLSILPPL